ncbi:MAG: ABC transporter permease [Armatimonadetes bacterium]|nr:ABC transporter permease [Armatimonadota bacterium]
MNLWQSLFIAVDMLRLHKLRAFLTMLGVIIGVMAVTLIVMLSEGFRSYINTEFKRLGADTLFVFYDPGRLHRGESTGGIDGLRMADIAYIKNRTQLIDIVSGFSELGGRSVRYGQNEIPDARVRAIDEYFLELNRFEVTDGRKIVARDLRSRANVCLIGADVRDRLFGDAPPLGKRISLGGITLEVIGVLETIEFMGSSTDDQMMVPLTTVQDKWVGDDRLAVIMMRPKPGVSVEAAMQEVWEVMMQKSGNRTIYRVDSRESILNVFAGIVGAAGVILGGIAALSLLVGGIGIMNIMLVSVTERTREIGLRKAVGAKRGAILAQFLVEAAVLSLAGGLIGMGFGWLLGQGVSAITRAMDWLGGAGLMVTFPLWAAIGAAIFSAVVGIVFGIYPAWSASRLDPIVALRTE